MTQIRREFNIELPLRVVFTKPTIASLALYILEEQCRLSGEIEELRAEPIRPLPRNENPPLSFGQRRLWFLNQLQPGSSAYNISNAIQLDGALDAGLLERCLTELARRHEVLRTTFAAEGDAPVQIYPSIGVRPARADRSDNGRTRAARTGSSPSNDCGSGAQL